MRIDCKMRFPDEAFIRPDSPEFVPSRKRKPLGNRQFHPMRHNYLLSPFYPRPREKRLGMHTYCRADGEVLSALQGGGEVGDGDRSESPPPPALSPQWRKGR